MNKKSTLIIAMLTGALLTGCGSSVSTASSNNSSTAKASSSEASSAAVTTSENLPATSAQQQDAATAAQNMETASAASTNAAVTDNTENKVPDPNAPSQAVAIEMLNTVNSVEKIASSGLQFDESQSYTDPNGNVYYKCTESNYDSVHRISRMMHRFLTPEFISRDYSFILDSDAPLCIDVDGVLYVRNQPRGARFHYSGGKVTIEKSFEGGYSVLAEYDNYGSKETADLQIVFADGHWMVSGLTLGI